MHFATILKANEKNIEMSLYVFWKKLTNLLHKIKTCLKKKGQIFSHFKFQSYVSNYLVTVCVICWLINKSYGE